MGRPFATCQSRVQKRHAGERETHWVNTSIDLSRSVKHFLPIPRKLQPGQNASFLRPISPKITLSKEENLKRRG